MIITQISKSESDVKIMDYEMNVKEAYEEIMGFEKEARYRSINEIYDGAELKMREMSDKLKAMRASRQAKDDASRAAAHKNDDEIRKKYQHKISSSKDEYERLYYIAKRDKEFRKLREKELRRDIIRNAIADYREGKLDIAVGGSAPRFDADIKAYKYNRRNK